MQAHPEGEHRPEGRDDADHAEDRAGRQQWRHGGAGLVGSYDEVAARIRAFHAAGIELFMLQFQPFEAEMARFAKEIIPRVRALQSDGPSRRSGTLPGSR